MVNRSQGVGFLLDVLFGFARLNFSEEGLIFVGVVCFVRFLVRGSGVLCVLI